MQPQITPAAQGAARTRAYNIETPDRILDAAERLFAARNYQTVTLRQIAHEAGANVGQIVYHFGKKETLVGEAIRRRAGELNAERLALLTQYEALVGPDNVEIEPLVRAILMPYFQRLESGDAQWQAFATFVGRSVWDGQLSAWMSESFDEVAQLYIAAFRRALPGLGPADAVRSFHFLMALMHAAAVRDSRIEGLIAAAGGATTPRAYSRILVPYIAAGIRAIAEDAG